MNTFLLNIASPDGKLFSGNVVMLTVRGAAGDLAVLAGHIPFVTTVRPCECALHMEDGTVRHARTEGGLLTVAKEDVTFLTAGFVWA